MTSYQGAFHTGVYRNLFKEYGFSGEAGHMIIEVGGRRCSCGRDGCWEAYASEHALLKLANQNSQQPFTLESLITLAHNNNSSIITLFEQVGRNIGYGITNLINTLNPEQVIIGNRMSVAKHWLKGPIEEAIRQHTLQFHQEQLQITFSKLSIYSTSLGVAAFSVENFFKEEQLIEQA